MLEDRFTRLWDDEVLPPRQSFDPDDDGQLNLVALHLLRTYWRFHDMEAFAALCAVLRPAVRREARAELGAEATSEELNLLVDGFLARLFGAGAAELPCVLHVRSFARSWMRMSRGNGAPRPPESLGFLAGVE